MRKGKRYRGGSRRDKGRVANTSLGSPCRPRFSFRAWFKGFGGRALAKTNTFSTSQLILTFLLLERIPP